MSGGVPAVLSRVMVSMSRTVEKPGPALYSPECVEEGSTEVGCLEPELLRPERLAEPFPGSLDELRRAYDLLDLGWGAVAPYVVFCECLPKGHLVLHAGQDVIGDLLLPSREGGASRAAEEPLPEGWPFAHEILWVLPFAYALRA